MHPRAIETRYKGYRFRSRLEARWAVFFDALGLKWEYEPEGFELPGGVRYLPDFRVNGTWFEVKPEGGDIAKPKLFADKCNVSVCILDGPPALRAYIVWQGYDVGAGYDPFRDRYVEQEHCLHENNLIFVPTWCKYHPFYWSTGGDPREFPADEFEEVVPDLEKAIAAARSARFEFGESGAR